jgi:hypothetical protein
MGAIESLGQVNVADGAALVRAIAREALQPELELKLSEWAESYRLLPSKTSSEPGPWRNARTPYLVEPMDCLSAGHPAEEIVVMKGTQIGGTEAGNNWIGYVIHQAPAPMMAIQPTLNLAKRFSKHRLATMIDEMPVLHGRVAEKRSRDTSNTALMKDFPGGILVIAGANSAADLRSMPCKYIFADEIDGYPFDVDGEGDPLALADKRASNFPRRKKFKTSTPTTKGFSRSRHSSPLTSGTTKSRAHIARNSRSCAGRICAGAASPSINPRPRTTSALTAGPRLQSTTRPRCSLRAAGCLRRPATAGGLGFTCRPCIRRWDGRAGHRWCASSSRPSTRWTPATTRR